MKALLFLSLFVMSASVFAAESETECSAMNESRSKIVKNAKEKTKTTTKDSSASAQ